MLRPLTLRVLLMGLCQLLLITVAGCAGGTQTDPLVELGRRVPASLAEQGLLLRRGVVGSEILADQLGVPATGVQASATTPAPALRVVLTDPDGVAEVLGGAGYVLQPGVPSGWVLLVRGPDVPGLLGVPAVAIGAGLVAVGGPEQLLALAAGGEPLEPAPVLAGVDAALLVPAAAISEDGTATGFAGGLPTFLTALLTVRGDVGSLALKLPGQGDQDDAVALAVRLRTEGPQSPSGAPLLIPETALTTADAVVVDVRWNEDAGRALLNGLDGDLLSFLGT